MTEAHKNNITIHNDGTLSLQFDNKTLISKQPVATVISDSKKHYPISADFCDNIISIKFECGNVAVKFSNYPDYCKFEVTEIDNSIDYFIFGPYFAQLPHYGELVGACWDDEYAVCIQSLNPKTLGGYPPKFSSTYAYKSECTLKSYYRHSSFSECAAIPLNSGVTLQCYAEDMSKTTKADYLMGARNAEVAPVSGPDEFIPGAAIALFACKYENLLDMIGNIEVKEDLPHPLKDGIWTKKNPRTTESYMMIHGGTKDTLEKHYEWVKKAGMKCLYSWGQFKSWGHFEMDPEVFDGDEGFREFVQNSKNKGIESGFHTLSNFINTNDPYVEGEPSEHLLVMDKTVLVEDIDDISDKMEIADENNYGTRTHLNCIKMGKELIRFSKLEKQGSRFILTGLERGAYKTKAVAHKKGETVLRLFDHGYKTLFPDLELQKEMGKRVAGLMKYAGVTRMSFDGIEGCTYTGRGEYACSRYTDDCYRIFGNNILCDASNSSHYRWHIHSYYNWGEPYYDYTDRGGMMRYRAGNQEYFDRNFIPHMLGQYKISLSQNKFEATSLENFEHILASTIAYNAGYGLDTHEYVLMNHGLTDKLLDASRIWEDMRFNGDIPQWLRDEMKDEYTDWHIEETTDGWDVYKMHNQLFDLRHYNLGDENEFASTMCIDRLTIPMPLELKIRVGTPMETGAMTYFAIHNGWGGFDPIVRFESINISAGDYIIFDGKNTLAHYDKNYNFIENITGIGSCESIRMCASLQGYDGHWRATEGHNLNPTVTFRHPVQITHIKRKS